MLFCSWKWKCPDPWLQLLPFAGKEQQWILGMEKYLLQIWIHQPSSLKKTGTRIHLVMWKCRMKMTPMAGFCRPRLPQWISSPQRGARHSAAIWAAWSMTNSISDGLCCQLQCNQQCWWAAILDWRTWPSGVLMFDGWWARRNPPTMRLLFGIYPSRQSHSGMWLQYCLSIFSREKGELLCVLPPLPSPPRTFLRASWSQNRVWLFPAFIKLLKCNGHQVQ